MVKRNSQKENGKKKRRIEKKKWRKEIKKLQSMFSFSELLRSEGKGKEKWRNHGDLKESLKGNDVGAKIDTVPSIMLLGHKVLK